MKTTKDKLQIAYDSGTLKFTVPAYDRILRYDQQFGAAFLCMNKRGILGSPIGSGKTIECVAALKKLADLGLIKSMLVVGSVSVLGQWQAELNGVAKLEVKVLGMAKQPRQHYIQFGSKRFLCSPSSLINDLDLHYANDYDCLVLDESAVVKNHTSATFASIRKLSECAEYVFFLSGQPYENNLSEIYGQAEACSPGIIGTPEYFDQRFCLWGKIKVRRNGRVFEIPKIMHYKHVDEFRGLVDPILLYRRDTVEKIPLKSMTIKVSLTEEQREIYDRLDTQLKAAAIRSKGDFYKRQGILLRAADSARFNGGRSSCKVDKVIEILQHQALAGKRFMIYTFYHEMVDHLKESLTALGLQVQTITGKENSSQRELTRKSLDSGTIDGVIVTDAGGKGIRLEGASICILVERPWSAKALEQIIGRVARQGQKAEYVVVVLIIAKDTVDEYVTKVISQKEKGATEFYGVDTGLTGEVIKNLDELEETSDKQKVVWR